MKHLLNLSRKEEHMFKLIIVEDEHLIRKWLEIAVDYSTLGIQVVGTASHGQEGMELIQKLKPHIVLTDITMPIMDAFMMFEATQSISYEKVILSGYDDFQNAKKAMQFGAVDFLSKPINIIELTECLEKIILRLQMDQHQNKPFLQDYQIFVASLQKINPQNQLIQQILKFIHQHYSEHFTISTIAENLGYSESYLYKVIKEDFPITLNEYILQYRLKQAVEKIIQHPDYPLSQIAEQVGFSDYKYFGKVFKKYFHISPKELKNIGRIV